MKKIFPFLCLLTMLFFLAACGSENSDRNFAATITGEVTARDGSTVTLQLGEMIEGTDNREALDGREASDGKEAPDGKEVPNDKGAPPEMPEGGFDNDQFGETPPERPDGADFGDREDRAPDNNSDGESFGKPGGGIPFTAGDETTTIDLAGAEITKNSETVSMEDISIGDILKVTFDDKGAAASVEIVTAGTGRMEGGAFGGPDGLDTVEQGGSANTITEDGAYSQTAYSSSGDDENALRIDGSTVTLEGITVDKSGGDSTNVEGGDFYGTNAAVLATNGAAVTIKDAVVTSSAQNGNGIFSYGNGTTVNISDSQITTTADNSGGIQTTGNGTTNAVNLLIETAGNSSAAIRSDRGGGTVNVEGGTYVSNGYNSPAVYSTAAISVKNAALTANNSEALVIEGKNSITLENCEVTGNMSDTKGTSSDENVHNVMIYQSMSGDADVGTSAFSMTGGTLTSKNGDMFYVTNTACELSLSGVSITNEDSEGCFMNICGNSASHGWGSAGKNGAQVVFTANEQTMSGNFIVDTISTLDMTLKGGSIFDGTINIVNNNAGGTAVSDNAVVTIEGGCTWNLTGDCTITGLTNNGTINFNGYTITLADGTTLNGE